MAIDQIDYTVLEGATMLRDVFADFVAPALERRIAWAVDCAEIDYAMYWLDVHSTLYGQPVDGPIWGRPHTP
jgi:hypothetical protein